MASAFNIHKAMAFLLNALLVGLVVYFVYKTDSDKSPIIFMLYYPALFILNVVIAIVLNFIKPAQAKIYKQILVALLIAFLPLVIIISLF